MSIAAPAVTAAGLCLTVRCRSWVVALDADCVERVAGESDVPEPVRLHLPAAPAALGGVVSGDVRFAAWDLGRLLGLGDVGGAWVLMRLPFDGKRLPVALRTGPCLGVSPLGRGAVRPLPLAAFRPERRAAIGGAVVLEGLGRQAAAAGALGIELRPERLLTRDELALSDAWLETSDGGGA